MSAVKSSSTLRSLVLTPERIPSFLGLSRSPLLFSPCFRRSSPERARLLSDHDDPPEDSPPNIPTSSAASPRVFPMNLSLRVRRPRQVAGTSLSHVPKVTTPAALAASPPMSRRESHRNQPLKVTVSDSKSEKTTPPRLEPNRSRVNLRPVKALGLQVMKELKKPAAALMTLSPSHRTSASHF